MRRLHIHISVNELSESINFYSTIFNSPPSFEREDYAKWDLKEPSINFAISNRDHTGGINHLGIQVDSENELEEIAKRLDKAEFFSSKQEGSSCCYAHSNKHWALDPQGIAWEAFHTLGDIPNFGGDTKSTAENESSACCIPLNMNKSDNEEEAACCISNEEDTTTVCCS